MRIQKHAGSACRAIHAYEVVLVDTDLDRCANTPRGVDHGKVIAPRCGLRFGGGRPLLFPSTEVAHEVHGLHNRHGFLRCHGAADVVLLAVHIPFRDVRG